MRGVTPLTGITRVFVSAQSKIHGVTPPTGVKVPGVPELGTPPESLTVAFGGGHARQSLEVVSAGEERTRSGRE